MKKAVIAIVTCLLATAMWAQDNSQQQAPTNPPMRRPGMGMMGGPDVAFRLPFGAWWKNSDIVQKTNLTDSQAQQIEGIFQQNRNNLELAGRAVYQAEQALKPLINTDQLNDAQINAQLQTVATARMNLEIAHAQMLLAIRKVLTLDQWKTLQSMGPQHPFGGERRRRQGQPNPTPPEL